MSDAHTTKNSTVTILDVDRLMSGATPQFSQQIRERVQALIAGLPEDNDVRKYAEKHIFVLERMADATTRGIRKLGVPSDEDSGWDSMPSHPSGGIAPGAVEPSH